MRVSEVAWAESCSGETSKAISVKPEEVDDWNYAVHKFRKQSRNSARTDLLLDIFIIMIIMNARIASLHSGSMQMWMLSKLIVAKGNPWNMD